MSEDAIKGGIYGLLIGDAMGVPYEFHESYNLKCLEYIDFDPPKEFNRSHFFVPPGTWSDDGAQALCLLDTLISNKAFDLDNFSNKLVSWYTEGLWAIDNNVFDIGIQTSYSLEEFINGTSSKEAGFTRPDGKGNGSLMRVLPLPLWHKGSDEELIDIAHEQSLITHGHECNQVCCALYSVWVKRVLEGLEIMEAFENSVETLKENYLDKPNHFEELDFKLRPFDDIPGNGSGFVIDTIRSVRDILFECNSYEDVVIQSILLGDDTDTTAAIAGGLAGVYYGYESIPENWINKLRGKELFDSLLSELVNYRIG